MKTAQEIFNISYLHVVRQGKPSFVIANLGGNTISDNISCRYRGNEGLQCAAAPFVVNYTPECELPFCSLLAIHPDVLDPDAIPHGLLIEKLQGAHDNAVRDIVDVNGEVDDVKFLRKFKK